MANEQMYSVEQVKTAISKWLEENQSQSQHPLVTALESMRKKSAMYKPVNVTDTSQMGGGFMNMPGYMAPMSTSKLNKIPSFWQGFDEIVKIIASIASMGIGGAVGQAMSGSGGMGGMMSGMMGGGGAGGGAGGMMGNMLSGVLGNLMGKEEK